MIALCLASVMTSAGHQEASPIRIAVVASRGATDALVNHICGEPATISEPAGIALECHRLGPGGEAGSWPVDVTSDAPPSNLAPAGALGWIACAGNSPNRSIHRSPDELGHHLRRTKAHRSRGPMGAASTADDSFSLTPGGLEFTREQRQAAFEYLASTEQAPATHGGHRVD